MSEPEPNNANGVDIFHYLNFIVHYQICCVHLGVLIASHNPYMAPTQVRASQLPVPMKRIYGDLLTYL